jgi:methionyl-tRNA formyltransferase
MKVIFYGNSEYSEIVLRTIKADKKFQIVKNPAQADVGVLASYGRILTAKELAVPKHGILNIHPSLLPKYRGPTPVPTAILNGDKKIGVSIIKMDEEIDHGPILSQFELEILEGETAENLLKRAFTAGAQVLITILPSYIDGRIKPKKQNHSQATYTKKFTRENGKINWQKPSDYIERQIRAFYPWPGTWTEVELRIKNQETRIKRLIILRAHLKGKKLVLDEVQLEGKKPVSFKQFLEGYPQTKII